MTQPRLIIPGESIFVTVRTVARFYLLRPDPELVEAIKYCLAHYSNKHGITLHAVCVMSTHMHLVLFDQTGNRSLFLRDADRAIANVVKAYRGWRGPVFRPKPNIVRLLTHRSLVDKIGYVLANPVAAGAVRRTRDWPGLCAAGGLSGRRPQEVDRPKLFFSGKSALPKKILFHLEAPKALIDVHGAARTRAILEAASKGHKRRAHAQVRLLGWKVCGPRHCLRNNPFKRAKAYEAFGAREPTFAVLGGGKPAYDWAARQIRAFRREYRIALDKWRMGFREVVFPYGTWAMRILHNAKCHDACTASLPSCSLIGQDLRRQLDDC